MGKTTSTVLTVSRFRAIGAAKHVKGNYMRVTARWQVPLSITLGHNGALYEAEGFLEEVIPQADGTFHYILRMTEDKDPLRNHSGVEEDDSTIPVHERRESRDSGPGRIA
jgi:hypothetical protein